MISESLQQETLDLLQRLVACPSLSGREQGVADILKEYLAQNGFSTLEIDRYGDLVAGVAGAQPGVRLLFDGHMDTVPAQPNNDTIFFYRRVQQQGRCHIGDSANGDDIQRISRRMLPGAPNQEACRLR